MDINGERSTVPADAERNTGPEDAERISREDHPQGNVNASDTTNSTSTVKIGSLCVDLGMVKEKGDHAQKCKHFSIRDYVYGKRERGQQKCLPFRDDSSNCSTEQLPLMEIPSFKYWRCQSCLWASGAATTLQEPASVSQCGQTVVQPCASFCTPPDCSRPPVLPFGEGTSGLKPIDTRDDNDSIPMGQSQPSPEIHVNAAASEEPTHVGSVDTGAAAATDTGAPDKAEGDQNGVVTAATTEPVVQPVQSDQQSDDPNGHPRRKHRKVRLLTELMCGNVKNPPPPKKKNSLDLGPRAPSPSTPPPQSKRKPPQDQDRRPADAGKKAKSIAKTGVGERSTAVEGAPNVDKCRWSQHGTQSDAIAHPITAWRSIIGETGRAEKHVSSAADGASGPAHNLSKGRGTDVYANVMPPPLPVDKKSKKTPENHQVFGDDLWKKKKDTGRLGAWDRQSDHELGLGLSLTYNPHVKAQVRLPPPLSQKQIPTQDHNRQGGFFLGESSAAHRVVTLDPKLKGGSVSEVNRAPRTAPHEPRHYYPHFSQPNFSQHQKLDFSDPHNKRNGGVRGFSDVTWARNHQRQEAFSGGRTDIKEIVELMAKNQYERSLCEGGSYYNASSFFNVSSNDGIPTPYPEYLTTRKPPSSISTVNMMPTGENRSSVGFFRQEPSPPAFTMFDPFSQGQPQSGGGGGIRFSNPRYHEFNGNGKMPERSSPTNLQVLEAFGKFRSGPRRAEPAAAAGTAWSTVPTTVSTFQHRRKSIMDLDLNVGLEDPNKNLDFERYDGRADPNPRHAGPFDSSYSNDAIPAMQLLSLMDAGKSNAPFAVEGRSYDNCGPIAAGKTYADSRRPVDFSRRFGPAHGPPLFQTDRNLKAPTNHGCHVFHKPPQENPSGPSGRTFRPDDPFVFPLPWHATEDRTRRVNMGAVVGPEPPTGVCGINQNPADFSTPGPANVFMIKGEDLKFRGRGWYKGKSVAENADGRKRQRAVKSAALAEQRPQQQQHLML